MTIILLQDKGGWTNPEIADHFNDYAALCFERFGDRVCKTKTISHDPFKFS